jgi:membrane complex biogenesis BtpA family protein
MTDRIHNLFPGVSHPVIGMVHLQALPGAPGFGGDIEAVRAAMRHDGEALAAGGVDALMVENFGDCPFFPGRVPAHVVSHVTVLAGELCDLVDLPVGINVLRNDGLSALAVAHAVGAGFIRVNVLSGARVTDQGIIEGIAHDLLRERNRLAAESVAILADVNVKHSAALADRPVEEEVADVIKRGGADAVIVSGSATGKGVDVEELAAVKAAAGDAVVFIGSGVSTGDLEELWPHADGFIVGTALKRDGVATNPIDPIRVDAFMREVGRLRGH